MSRRGGSSRNTPNFVTERKRGSVILKYVATFSSKRVCEFRTLSCTLWVENTFSDLVPLSQITNLSLVSSERMDIGERTRRIPSRCQSVSFVRPPLLQEKGKVRVQVE